MRGLLTAALFLAALLSTASAKAACDLDSAPSTHWSVARHGAISSLVTPCGDSFFSTGVNVLDGGITAGYLDRPHYDWRNSFASLGDWIAQTKQRLADWGFNSAGAWSLPPKQLKLPSIINLELGRLARFHWFDPFDPAAEQRMFDQAKALTETYRNSPYRIGYFADNEVGWWDGALFLFYGQQAATSFTKQRWLQMLREQYRSNWQSFTADFVPPAGIASWDALLNAEKPTKLRIGGDGMPVVERWTGIVAGQYYKVARAALKAADPDALFFGDRLPIYYDQAAIRAEAPYVDAIALNYNVDSPEGWLAPYFFDGLRKLTNGKPELISEWFYAAHENRTGNRNNGHLMTVETPGAARRRRRGIGRSSSPACPRLSARIGSNITTIRLAAAPTARTTISASSISKAAPMRNWSRRSAPPIANCRRSTIMPARSHDRARKISSSPMRRSIRSISR